MQLQIKFANIAKPIPRCLLMLRISWAPQRSSIFFCPRNSTSIANADRSPKLVPISWGFRRKLQTLSRHQNFPARHKTAYVVVSGLGGDIKMLSYFWQHVVRHFRTSFWFSKHERMPLPTLCFLRSGLRLGFPNYGIEERQPLSILQPLEYDVEITIPSKSLFRN